MKRPEPWLAQAHTIHRVVQIDLRRTVQLTLLLGLIFSVLLAIPFVFYHRAESGNHLSLLQAEQERAIKLAAGSIHQEIDAVLSDLRFLSQNNEIRNYLARTDRSNRENLAMEYLGLARQKRTYDQVRFIGLDGMEMVRVDFNDGMPEIVADQNLLDKSERDFFKETLWLSPGQVYVSPFDLSSTHGAVVQPPRPVIRFAAPVADGEGLIRGIVVLNYLGKRLHDKLGALEAQGGRLWLLNAEGYWLFGPTPEDEWGFLLPERSQRSLAKLSPRLWQQIVAEKSGVHQSAESLTRFERIYPLLGENASAGEANFDRPADAGRYYWIVAAELPQSALTAADHTLHKWLWTVYGALVLSAFLVAGAFAFAICRNRALSQALEKILDNLPLLVAYVDAEQRYRFNNMAHERFFGLSPKQIYGRTMQALLGEAAYQAVLPHIEQALAGKPVAFESRLAYAGAGMRDVMVSYLPDSSPQGEVRGFYVMVNDVSLIKESERREREHILKLAHVSRLASMGEMATGIAHEINQPLAAIALYSAAGLRTLRSECDRDKMEAWLEAINAQSKRAGEIVRRVRSFVQKGEPQSGPVDLNLIVRETATMLANEPRSQEVKIDLELAEDLPSAQGDRALLEQVVFNLARNAIDAVLTQPGERRVTLRTTFDAQLIYVEISDTGLGVDPALGEHIFDSFVTSKQEGVGMGLTISRSIIEAHASTLRYTPNPGGGATFTFSLAREAR